MAQASKAGDSKLSQTSYKREMNPAFVTWEAANETLKEVERRIHDGAAEHQLHERAQTYVNEMFGLFPWLTVSSDDIIVEVGPGVGYIMQALAQRVAARRVIGLDVAAGMIGHARARLARDGLSPSAFEFVPYDGVNFPFADRTVDFFYSVAAIQHVPKPLAYNIFLEITRCLKSSGVCVLHLLSWDHLPHQHLPFSEEVHRQVKGEVHHWHHFYDRIELERVMEHGLHAPFFQVRERGSHIWVAWSNDIGFRQVACPAAQAELKQQLADQTREIANLKQTIESLENSMAKQSIRPIARITAGLRGIGWFGARDK